MSATEQSEVIIANGPSRMITLGDILTSNFLPTSDVVFDIGDEQEIEVHKKFYTSREECVAASMLHVAYNKILEFRYQQYQEQQGMLEHHGDIPMPKKQKQCRSIALRRSEYLELIDGHRFIVLISGFGNTSTWYLFRHHSGALYFVIESSYPRQNEQGEDVVEHNYAIQSATGRLLMDDIIWL